MTKRPQPNPVSADDAEFFASCVKRWQHALGLHDWRIAVSDRRSSRKVMAEVFKFDIGQRSASIRLGKHWSGEPVTPDALDQTALHEVLHIMLHELIETARSNQDEEAIGSAEHRIINVLEVLLPMLPGAK